MATESAPPQSEAAETEENPQPSPSPANPPPSSASLSEALRLRDVAESKLRASSYSALKYAKRASHLSPSLPGLSDLIDICKILSCDPSDPYNTLSLAPTSSLAAVHRRYKTLALSLHPDKLSSVAAEEAFKRVSAAFQLLTEIHKKGAGSTFWTACGACRLLHEFDRKYVGYRLVCPRCRKSFLAKEVPAPASTGPDKDVEGSSDKVSKPTSATEPATQFYNKRRQQFKSSVSTPFKTTKREVEKTLAEMQVELTKNKKKQKTKENENKKKKMEDSETEEEDEEEEEEDDEDEEEDEDSDDDEENGSDVILRRTKYKGSSGLMTVEDSDFYNFDKDRDEKSFRKGQIWAIYDDDDGMPRYYGLIEEVLNSRSFTVRLRWLDLYNELNRKHALLVEKSGNRISCGQFKVGKMVDLDSVNLFSHSVWSERAARELYRIYPKKGSIWALYSGKMEFDGAHLGGARREYDIVLALTSYSEAFGLSFAYLEKVAGYKTIFKRSALGSNAVSWVDKEGVRVFSHQIPARLLTEKDAVVGLEGVDCWELDPASLPPQLLCLDWEKKKLLN
ncbi:DNAJ heat shock N-terminal domain-containing family protein [Rhynchospora pubera]|uniref:DNAJ heat shock N-terminal domain-containing family protein n=1 Tax=Rhynchospora pubera TaxID=906938 RepID=A0AAV8ESG7_9POAL|nr:DNAJ heat shock N-terminal domain-containing family protein [Rhynchospora pubera]